MVAVREPVRRNEGITCGRERPCLTRVNLDEEKLARSIGISQVLGTAYLAQYVGAWIVPYQSAIPLIIMVIVLLVIPRGIGEIIFGRVKGSDIKKK